VPGKPLGNRPRRPRRADQLMERVLGGTPQSKPQEVAAAAAQPPPDATELEQSPSPLQQLTDVLADQPLTLYTDDLPQVMAEETAERVAADVVALLLDTGRGVLDVAGGVGLDEKERNATISHDDEAVRTLMREGVRLYRSARSGSGPTSLPGSSAGAFVVAPLLHEGLGFGVLLAGRKQANGQPAPAFSDGETNEILAFARDATPLLRTAVLLRYCKAKLQTPD
jgi:hypothetical protein